MLMSHVDREFQYAEFRRKAALHAAERKRLVRDLQLLELNPYPNEQALSILRTIGQLTFSLAVTAAILSVVFGSIAVIAGIWV